MWFKGENALCITHSCQQHHPYRLKGSKHPFYENVLCFYSIRVPFNVCEVMIPHFITGDDVTKEFWAWRKMT
jgi:hypothetical protein